MKALYVLRFLEETEPPYLGGHPSHAKGEVDRAKAVTLFPSYYKTTLRIGLVPGFEPATYRSYATKLTPPADSAVVKYGFLSARCLLTFGDHLWFMTEKLHIPFFFAHKALHFCFQ